ncbi:MAG: hypothetical protein M3135_06430, partial [Actinomycetota bacterium]|nr:hypothetical protein [Actinomycetota bacterium]
PRELLAGLAQLRVWGLRTTAAASAEEIVAMCGAAGFTNIKAELVGDRVIAPALRVTRRRLATRRGAPASIRVPAAVFLGQTELLWRRRAVEYLLLRAERASAR